MKKIVLILLIIIASFSFVSCNNKKPDIDNKIEDIVASELANIENFKDLNSETQKALSIVYRTKISYDDDFSCHKTNIKSYNENIETAKTITNQTKDEVLDIDYHNIDNLIITKNINKDFWQKTINKADILKFLKKNNISLANVSQIEPKFDERKRLTKIVIANKEIPYSVLEKEFGLLSNNIIDIKTSFSSITIIGKPQKKYGYFDITEAEVLAQSGKNCKQLLNHFYLKNSKI